MPFAFHKCILRSSLLLACLLCLAQSAQATTVLIPPDDDLITGARAIVRAKVLSVNCAFDEHQSIYTYITLRVREVIKGRINERRIVIKEPGGQVGAQGTLIFGSPKFKPGEEAFLYLDTWNDGSLRVHQMFLGKFLVVDDPQTGQRVVVRDGPDQNTVVLDAGTRAEDFQRAITNRMELSAYAAMVRRRLAANLERAREFEAAHYENVAVLARPPEYGRAESRRIQPQFTFITNPPVRWFDPDDGLPVTFTVNLDGAPNPQVLDDITAAMNAWSSVEGCSMRVIVGGTGEVCYTRDVNSMVFNNCDGQFSPSPFCAGVLAIGGLSWDSGQSKVVNGTTFVAARTGHISFNPYAGCAYEDHCQVREIVTHELGHALGLGHSWNPCSTCAPPTDTQRDATMYGIAHFDGRCASLRQDDINGVLFIYPATNAGPGPLAIVTESPLQTGLVDGAYSQSLVASGGTAPYTWQVASGSLPAGVTLNTNSGLLAGTPSGAGSFSFTARVTDAGSRSADKAMTIMVLPPALTVTTNSIPNGQQGSSFNYQLAATGGKPPYTWAVAVGTLPAALSLNAGSGIISGAPAAAGSFDFTIEVKDSDSRATRKALSLTVASPPLSIETATLLGASKGSAFSYKPGASGGKPPYTWMVASGALPAGLSINASAGLISGTPSAAGTFAAAITVRDQEGRSATGNVQIKVIDPATAPHITKVKYKAGKKLIVNAERVDRAAALIIDGVQAQAKLNEGQFVAKKLTLLPGQHAIKVVNPGDAASQTYILNVN